MNAKQQTPEILIPTQYGLSTDRTNGVEIPENFAWPLDAVHGSSPLKFGGANAEDPLFMIGQLFRPDDRVWVGGRHGIGDWRTVRAWREVPRQHIQCTLPDCHRHGHRQWTYLVMCHDRAPSWSNYDPSKDVPSLIADALAVTRWLREKAEWTLRAIVWPGGPSLITWWKNPWAEWAVGNIDAFRRTAPLLGVSPDDLLLNEKPVPLPGCSHKSGNRGELLWIDPRRKSPNREQVI